MSLGQLDTQRIAVDRFWLVARQGTLLAIVLHAVFAVFGWAIDAMPLVIAQAVTVTLYCVSYALAARRRVWLAVAVAWLDLLVHATVACWIVGIESGFQYYSWILLLLVFANVHRKMAVKITLAIALMAFFVAVDWWLHKTPPLVHVHPLALDILRYFNIACFLLAMGVIAAAYGRTVTDAERRLNSLASTDTLTGLLNRRRMSDRMKKELTQARSAQQPLSVLLLDIDHFKSINDQFGHARGDQVIVAMSEVLSAHVRQRDLVARWGGEEFLVLQPDASPLAARDTAERIRCAVAQCLIRDDLDATPVTVTVGIATWRGDETLEDTIHRADRALYIGKQSGRDRVVVDGDEPSLTAQKISA